MDDFFVDKKGVRNHMENLVCNNRTYPALMPKYLEFVDEKKLDAGSTETLSAWVDTMNSDPAKSIRTRFYSVKFALIDYAEKMNYPPEQIYKLIKRLKEIYVNKIPKSIDSVKKDRILTKENYDKLLNAADEKLKVIMEFLWCTGCSISEMSSLLKTDIYHKKIDDTVSVLIRGKGCKERVIKIKYDLLKRINAVYGNSKFLFHTKNGKYINTISVTNQIIKISKQVLNGTIISAHDFRHSFAVRKIRETMKIPGVSEYLGHSSLATTYSLYNEALTQAEILA